MTPCFGIGQLEKELNVQPSPPPGYSESDLRILEGHFETLELDALLREVAVAAITGTGDTGGHHKRWVLQEIVRNIQACEVVTKEAGIAP